MSLTQQDLDYYKHKFFTECLVSPFTNFKLNILKTWAEPEHISPDKMAKMFKVKVHIIDSALLVAKCSITRWAKKNDLTKDELGEILDEVLR